MRANRAFLRVAGVASALVMTGGCFLTTNLNSGKVIPEDEVAFTMGFTRLQEIDVGATIMQVRFGAGEDFDVGGGIDMLTLRMDGRYQFLHAEEQFVDMAAEVGMGFIVFALPTYYIGLGVSRDLGPITPYVHYRWTDLSLMEVSDLEGEDEDDDFIFDSSGWGQFSVGIQLKFGDKGALVIEYTQLDGVEGSGGETLSAITGGFRIGAF